jgi:16S rRNA processing protein RimM
VTDLVVGRVARAHGVTGELAVDVRTDSPDRRFAVDAGVRARLRDGSVRELTVAGARPHGGRVLVRFAEVVTRDVAETLRGALLYADSADLPPPQSPDEFYDHDLQGLAAVLGDGTPVGTVRQVVHVPGGELLVVERNGGGEVLVPFVRAIVPEVDLAGRRIVLDPPEGLLEL